MNPRLSLVQCCGLLAASIWPALAVAQAPPEPSERDYFEELPVVLSVSRLAQPLQDAPGAVTVIDRETIRRSGVRELAEVLRLVPGFQVAHVPNGQPTASYHGIAEDFSRHLQVLVDGRSQYSPFFMGGVNWNLVPVSLDDIERIEVMRGSNSAAYGSNSFLGVVNIVTRHAADTHGAALEVRSGTQGVNDRRVRLGAGGSDFHVRATAEGTKDKGYEFVKDDRRQQLLDLRADWRLGLSDELQLQAGEIVTNIDVGSGSTTNPRRNQQLSQQFVAAGWKRTLDAGEDLSLRYYRTEESGIDAFVGNDNGDTVFVDYGYRSIRNNVEAKHSFGFWRDGRVVWGGEYRTDQVRAPIWYGTQDDVSLSVVRGFANVEWRFGTAATANVGGTWERDTNSKTTFAPRAVMNWHVTPEQTLRFGVARAYRAPSLYETRGNAAFVSTTGLVTRRGMLADGSPLRPESVTSAEIGWVGEFRNVGLVGDVRLFRERVADRILALETILPVPVCNVLRVKSCVATRGYNAAAFEIRGGEYQLRWQPARDTRVILNQSFVRVLPRLNLPAAGSVAGFVPGLYPPVSDIENRELGLARESAPTHTTMLMIMQRLPGGLELSATHHTVGAMKWSNNTRAVSWQRLDWRLGYRFRAGPSKGELAFTVQSDGTPHGEHSSETLSSRRGYFSLLLEF